MNVKTYIMQANKTRYISFSEARKVIPTIKVGDIIRYTDKDEAIVCKDERIAVLKRTTRIPYTIERIDI